MSANRELVSAVRNELAAYADPVKAPQMQAYLKSELPCYGVTVPLQREIVTRAAGEYPITRLEDWRDTVLELHRGARHREEFGCAGLDRKSVV